MHTKEFVINDILHVMIKKIYLIVLTVTLLLNLLLFTIIPNLVATNSNSIYFKPITRQETNDVTRKFFRLSLKLCIGTLM